MSRCELPAAAAASHVNRLDSSLLGMPSGPWPLLRQGPKGPETYLVPDQLAAIRHLPEPERGKLLRFVREHEANLAAFRQTSRRFFRQVNGGTIHSAPEYTMDLGEVMMGIDDGTAADDNPLNPHEPVLQALPEVLKVATGAGRMAILPNSRRLYHLDMFVAPLADGVAGLLAPDDPERLPRVDRDTLARALSLLQDLGFRIVPVPTSAARIASYQSPVKIVLFTDRRTGQTRALVPMFPEDPGLPGAQSLNARVLATYRAAGIDPVPVEDRFHLRWGNTHCALLALH